MANTNNALNAQQVENNFPKLVLAWAWAGLPLAWGILQTLHKAAALFTN